VISGLKRDDLFTVVHEQFFTDTTDYADYVLPATTFFEHRELQTAYGHYWLQVSDRAIEPLGECKSNVDLFCELALRMGFDEPCFRDSVDDMIDAALASDHPHLHGIDRGKLQHDGHVRLNFSGNGHSSTEPYLPFAEGEFPTRSGKAELYSESLAQQGLDPVVQFVPNPESRHNADPRFPLELLARKADNFLNSTFANLPGTQRMESPGLLELHNDDAAKRGIANGDDVRVFNSRGELHLRAVVNGSTRPGVVAARLNWAKLTRGGKNINVLTSQRLTDIGRGATFYATLVEVEKLRQ
jgi:anaerobic selenocysteine-containing dehydrogenase